MTDALHPLISAAHARQFAHEATVATAWANIHNGRTFIVSLFSDSGMMASAIHSAVNALNLPVTNSSIGLSIGGLEFRATITADSLEEARTIARTITDNVPFRSGFLSHMIATGEQSASGKIVSRFANVR